MSLRKMRDTERVGQDGRVEAERTEISKEAEAVLKGNGKHAPTPTDQSADQKKSNATTNSLEKWFTIIAPRHDRGNEAEDGAEDSSDVDDRKDPSVMGPPGLPASAIRDEEKKENSKISFSMRPAGLRNSAKRGKRRKENGQNISSMGPPESPASATGGEQTEEDSQTSSSMDPPGLPAGATRGNEEATVGQGAGAVSAGQGKKYWSMDDLPVERYTADGRRIW